MPLDLTFQKRMEQIDEKVEVINFGTPGYNSENVADNMQEVLADIGADFAIYIAHKNDRNPPLKYSPESFKYFASQVDRMIDISRREKVRLLISYLSTRIPMAFPQLKNYDFQTLKDGEMDLKQPGFRVGILDIEHGWKKFSRIDFHMGQAGHQETAEKVCQVISGGPKNLCAPPFWRTA